MSRTRGPGFEDHFSGHAALYAAHRPRYPAALFDWLARVAPGTGLAWDAGTGSGQVAHGLAARFARVVATDASAEQVAHAVPHARIAYAVGTRAEAIPDGAAQLVTVGQAVHWFDLAAFSAEVRRVLGAGGVLAVFGYTHNRVTPSVDALVRHFHDVTLAAHWPAGRQTLLEGYPGLALPFARELETPAFEMREEWTLAQFLGYLRTWSAAQRLLAAGGAAVVGELEAALREAWGDEPVRPVTWPMVLRAGVAG